jgi:alpha-mannosidase
MRLAKLFAVLVLGAAALTALTLPLSALGQVRAKAAARPAAVKLEVKPTILFVQEGKAVFQRIEVGIDSTTALPAGELQVRQGTKIVAKATIPAAAGRGKSVVAVNVPDRAKPVKTTFRFKAGRASAERTVDLVPQRKWTLYLLPHSHTDIGYTDLQTRVTKNHVEYLDRVVEFCRVTDGYPEEAKFRWNIEVSWALQNYIRTRPAEQVQALLALLRSGRVELSAWYLQLSDLFAHEELIRAVLLSREYSRTYGFKLQAAMNNDVTGFSWASPQILNQVGVRYFTTGINETRSRAPLRRPNPFYWQSPDGSRILHWNGEHYLFANYDLLIHEGYEKSFPKVVDYLAKLERRGDFPYDQIAFHISGYVTDNCPPRRELSDRVREWNAKWSYPKLRLATMSEFFEAFEKKFAKAIPTYKLGWPDYWTDGVASTAFETGLNRQAHNELLTAEKLATVAGLISKGWAYPGGEIREAYDQAMLYDEHTWGGWNSIDDPESEFARGQWGIKSGYAYAAREIARSVTAKSLAAVLPNIPNAETYALAVFNPLSWERSDIVRIALPAALVEKKGEFKLLEKKSGAEISYQIVDKGTLLFQTLPVPSLGYAVYTIVPDVAPSPPAPVTVIGENRIENRYYKAIADPVAGGLASLVDKETGAELVDRKGPFTLNQFIYENPEGGRKAVDDMAKRAKFNRYSPVAAEVSPGLRGPGASSLVITAKTHRHPEIRAEVILYDGLKRVDIVNRLKKEETYDPEAAYFAFPFRVEAGKVRFEIADETMAPEAEQLPGTTRDWQTVQHWVEIAGPKQAVVWSPVEAPLVQFGDINTGKWLKTLNLARPSVFSYALNNYWMTNFKASQGGTLVFRYSVTSRSGGADPGASSRFGWEAHTPLAAAWLPAKSQGGLPADAESFFGVDKPNVFVQAVKRAEDGEGIVLRLREVAGLATEARISTSLFHGEVVNYRVGDIGETLGNTSSVVPSSIVVKLKPFEIATVKIWE